MRECWVNVYPRVRGFAGCGGHWVGLPYPSVEDANRGACGVGPAEPWMLRAAGVGYRLHVRLKPTLAARR